jgi:hypothetical protein
MRLRNEWLVAAGACAGGDWVGLGRVSWAKRECEGKGGG